MKSLICVAIPICAIAGGISAEVKLPFDVPTPAWEILVTAKDEGNPPPVFQKPNASSHILVKQCGEECNFQWASRSAIPEWWDMVLIYKGMNYPLISQNNGWANIEYDVDPGDFTGWATSRSLAKVKTLPLSRQDVADSDIMVAWEVEGDLYAVVEAGGGVGYQDFYIGKYHDGYVVCPYICIVDLDGDSDHPGILNGVVGNSSLSKFTRRDVEYLLNHADIAMSPLVVYKYMESDGSTNTGTLITNLVSPTSGTPSADAAYSHASEDNTVYTTVEINPEFPGGRAAMFTHIAKNQRYPLIAQENGEQGKVVVGFVVEKDGSVSDVKVIQSVSPSLDRESIRVIETFPKFSPGKINGNAVRAKMSVPVTFRLVNR